MIIAEPLAAALQTVAAARILFGHQSVGRDVLDGAAKLALEHGVPLRIRDAREASAEPSPGLFQASIGANRDPVSKCRAFADCLLGVEGIDAALMKFCYVDLDGHAPLGPAALLELYASVVSDIHHWRPGLRLVHVTMPLCAAPRGRRYLLRRAFAQSIPEHADNALRNVYNDALRARYGDDEPIFDLERVEFTGPGSNIVTYREARVRVLAADYTTDGGHLNEAGKRAAAIELVRTLAQALRRPVTALTKPRLRQ